MKKYRFLAAILLLAIILVSTVAFAACNPGQDKEDTPSGDELPSGAAQGEKGLSATTYDFDAEYFYSDYNSRVEDFKVFEDKEIVFQQVGYDELNYLLNSKGNYLILLGGSWCGNTTAAIGYINELAKKYGIDKVYNFDFRLDGVTSAAHIRESETKTNIPAAQYNYLYGELVDRYLTNLNDWVEYKEDGNSNVQWTDKDGEKHFDAKVQVPFLFLYNKDNATHYIPKVEDGKQVGVEDAGDAQSSKTYPIVYGFEEMVNRDADGVFVYNNYSEKVRIDIHDAYLARLEKIFKYIDGNNIKVNEYSDATYFRSAYTKDRGGQKLFNSFAANGKINLKQITYRQLVWLFEQEGNAVILFAGAWCGNSSAVVGAINDYAVANDITVYVFDNKLDGGYSNNFWGYPKQLHIRDNNNPFAYLYVDLVNKYIPNAEVLYGAAQNIKYEKDGASIEAQKMQVPYLLAYNKDAVDSDGVKTPALAWYEEMLTISDTARADYFYKTDNYNRYNTGIYSVISAYAERVGAQAKQYAGDPRQPLV